ncbi:putative serine protease K12H4.7 isoform X2 [Planococcus citri]|uniref:putative serine protease K12H4.7 isoform X2 n=1 Tax=Planococcus citri TaxID=170843 RepID=UPI0031F76B6E
MIFFKTIISITWILLTSSMVFSSNSSSEEELRNKYWQEMYLGITDRQDEYFVQKLDHLDPTNGDTWLQRYWVNSKYHKKGGPAFLWLNGEGPGTDILITAGRWKSYAEYFNATLFSLEHRFYGQSMPKNDTRTEHLVYLSSKQAVADIANFIQGMSAKYALPNNTKWILTGCSYSGSLAAWARLKYPQLVHGAVSSSAPLLAKKDFTEYYQVVKTSFDFYKPKCSSKIAEANRQLDLLIKNDEGRKQATKLLNLCSELKNNTDDTSTFFNRVAELFAEAALFNNKMKIETLCDKMASQNATTLQSYSDAISYALNESSSHCLLNSFQNKIDELNQIPQRKSYPSSARQWLYQTCTEFGWYPVSNISSDFFLPHISTEFYIKQCKEVVGPEFNESLLEKAVNETNNFYGGLKMNVGNVVFVHGSIDPWRSIGITRAEIPNASYQTIYINDQFICFRIRPLR